MPKKLIFVANANFVQFEILTFIPISIGERSAKGTSLVSSSVSRIAKLHISAALKLMSSGFFCRAEKGLNKIYQYMLNLCSLMTKPTKWHEGPAKTQISLGICPVWSESSMSAWRKLGSLATHWAHSEDSDQTGWMPRLIWVFAGCTVILLVLSWGGSNVEEKTKVLEAFHSYSGYTQFVNNLP